MKVELFDRGITDGDATCDNNYTTDFMRESFGEYANADIEFVLVPNGSRDDKLNVLMASKSAPDVCCTYDRNVLFQYATQGGLTPLDQYYKDAPLLQAKLGDAIDYAKCEGEIVAIPGLKSFRGQYSTVIRQDWLDACGLEAPTTTEEWYNTLKVFKEKDPGNLGELNYPFVIRTDHKEIQDIIWSFVDPDLTEEEDFTLPWLLLPGWKDGMQFLNQLYNEGLINPEFALDQNNTMYKQAITTGAWGSARGLTSRFFAGGEGFDTYKNIPETRVTVIDPFVNEAGEVKKSGNPVYSLFNFVPSFSEVPDLAMQYFEWMAQPEVATRLIDGIEGIHWKYDENGYRVPLSDAEQPEEWRGRQTWHQKDWYLLDAHPDITLDPENALAEQYELRAISTYVAFSDEFPDNPELVEYETEQSVISMESSIKDMFVDNRLYPSYDKVLDSVSKYQVNLDKIYADGYVKIITAAPDEFEAVYQQIVDQYLQSGGQAIIDEKTAYYQELHS
ncbi:MAG: extracellular solute-binding protein [Candidatus Merdivicinus sp.]